MTKEKKPLYVTDVCEARWIWLHQPDTRPYKGQPVPPRYRVSLVYDGNSPEWQTFQKQLDAWADEAEEAFRVANPRKRGSVPRLVPYQPEVDNNDNETGFYVVAFQRRAAFADKSTGKDVAVRVPIFDAKGKPFPEDQIVGNGSRLRVSYTVRPYATNLACGITLDIKAVMVHEVNDRPARGAQHYGFDVEAADPAQETCEDEPDAVVF